MQKIKIDIAKKEIEVNADYYIERICPKIEAKIFTEGEETVCEEITYTEIVYHAMKVYNPDTKEYILYYVKNDDKGIFQDLICVSQGFIDYKVECRVDEELREIRKQTNFIERETKNKIKNIPWYKRLFNLF